MSLEEAIKILAYDEEYFLTKEEHEAYIMAIEALKEKNERKQEWIPCSERLPEKNGVYLVTGENGHVFEYDYSDFTTHNERWSYCKNEIIAWMPLPEPYKRGEAE